MTMKVEKRDGSFENISFDKILDRIQSLCNPSSIEYPSFLNKLNIDPAYITKTICDELYDGVKTSEIDKFIARKVMQMVTIHPDYGELGSRITISDHHKNTSDTFYEKVKYIYEHTEIITKEFYELVMNNKHEIQKVMNYDNDYTYDYFAFKTLERSYLIKVNDQLVERPQDMLMRVSLGLHSDNLENAFHSYKLLSHKYFIHASPTLFNAGTKSPQLLSCFLIGLDDSIQGIYKCLSDCAQISKWAGGIGIHMTNIRANKSLIKGTNGKTSGIVPMLKVFNDTACYVNQCFTPNTWVYSLDGPKQIKNITNNDELVTIDGTFKKINKIIKNNVNKKILNIRVTNSLFPVQVTKEHQLYLIKNQKKGLNFSLIKNRLKNNLIKPKYYSADELTENDLVGFPIPSYINDIIDYDEDFCKFYGMMLGDGFFCKNRNECGICLGTQHKSELIDFTKRYLDNLNIHYWITKQNGSLSFKWTFNEKLNISRHFLYDSNNDKRIHQSFLHLPKNKTLKLIEGLLKTDGSNQKELVFCSSSLQLVMDLRYILLRLGILTSGYESDRIDCSHVSCYGSLIETKKINYNLRIPKDSILEDIIDFKQKGIFKKHFLYDGMLWGRVRNIQEIDYSGEVFDFNMIDNHNYLTDMGLVHNSGKRNGSFAIYLEPHHADIFDFLDLKKNHGNEAERARDLFYAVWISDLFMKRVLTNEKWSLFSSDQCPHLENVYGEEYEKLYVKYEQEKKYRIQVNARDLWTAILQAQIETGTPYIGYKDHVNRKSNQQNLGTIKSSNLCVAPETKILTKNGYYMIKDLENQYVEIWNGEEFSKSLVKKTSKNQELIKIEFDNGSIIECTPYHKFYIIFNNSQREVTAIELTKGDQLISYKLPGEDNVNNVKVKNIIQTGRMSETYCFNEPKKHKGIFNGVIAGNCIEINEYSDDKEYACCTLASLSLPSFVKQTLLKSTDEIRIIGKDDCIYCDKTKELLDKHNLTYKYEKMNDKLRRMQLYEDLMDEYDVLVNSVPIIYINNKYIGGYNELKQKYFKASFDYELLGEVTKTAIRNLNKVIDLNYYPVPETKRSNERHRPLGLGVQGLADAFIKMRYPFDSQQASELNKKIFETIYYYALKESLELAKKDGPYSTFKGSPLSQGKFQFDLWNKETQENPEWNKIRTPFKLSGMYDWEILRNDIMKYGVRNSLLVALIPTASTSQILGNNEAFEPYTSNIYTRSTLAGEFIVMNKWLIQDLIDRHLWSRELKDKIVYHYGSIQAIDEIPNDLKELYKTVWEIKQKTLIDMSADRGYFVDQSQSLNLFVANPKINTLSKMHMYAWKKGLKTGIYYLRQMAAAQADQFSLDMSTIQKMKKQKQDKSELDKIKSFTSKNEDICESCQG